jgi:hypothetical protein
MNHASTTPPAEAMTSDGLICRRWNDTPITRRPGDGYVNATAMCKANAKLWADFWRTDRCSHYLEALATVMGNPTTGPDGLVQSKQGGPERGTWVHPDMATELARWISPAFSVFVNQWFREEFERRNAPQGHQALQAIRPQETLSLIERSYNLLERLQVVDERDRIQFGDMVRHVTATAAGGMLLPSSADQQELSIAEAWLEVTGQRLPRAKGPSIGKVLAAMFRKEFQQEPPTRMQYVDGAPRQVNSYRRGWLIEALRQLCNPGPAGELKP